MFSVFKRDNYWENQGSDQKEPEKEDKEEDEEEGIGLLIHLTRLRPYVYIILDGPIESDEGSFTVVDDRGREIEITGTVIATSVNRVEDVDQELHRFGVTGDVQKFMVTADSLYY